MLKRGKRTNASKGKKSNSKNLFLFFFLLLVRSGQGREKKEWPPPPLPNPLLLWSDKSENGRGIGLGNFARFGITSGGGAGKKGSKGECGEAPLVILPWKRGGNNHNKQEMWRGAKIISPSPLPPYPTFPILCIRCNAHPQEDVYTVG